MTTTALARRYRLQVNTGTTGAPNWVSATGLTDFKPKISPTMQDDSDYDSDGWTSSEKTAQGWSVEATVLLKEESGVFNAAVELLRTSSYQFGEDCHVEVRWFDIDGKDEAYQGTGVVEWERANSGITDLDAAKVTITGRGALTEITNPVTVDADADPVITSISPSTGLAAAGGDLITIYGGYFTGATGVTFGGTAATDFVVISPSVISAVTPAKAAGTYEVVVTTPNGSNGTTGDQNNVTYV